MTNINTELFRDTDVIKLLKNKQTINENNFAEHAIIDDNFAEQTNPHSANTSQITVCTSTEPANELCNVNPVKPKSNRGRKKKYATDEERILARRAQQKAYRERKKKELLELRELKSRLDAYNIQSELNSANNN